MPPQGKPQLTEEEIEIITQWIRKGSDFKLKVIDLSPDDTLRQIAQKIFTASEIAEYDFDEADPSTIQKLNTENRVVSSEAIGSPALSVNFFNSSLFTTDQLRFALWGHMFFLLPVANAPCVKTIQGQALCCPIRDRFFRLLPARLLFP